MIRISLYVLGGLLIFLGAWAVLQSLVAFAVAFATGAILMFILRSYSNAS